MPPGHVINGVSALLNADGEKIVEWVKTKEGAEDTLALSAAIKDEFGQYKGYAKLVTPPEDLR